MFYSNRGEAEWGGGEEWPMAMPCHGGVHVQLLKVENSNKVDCMLASKHVFYIDSFFQQSRTQVLLGNNCWCDGNVILYSNRVWGGERGRC